jgi:hypothetical protein
MTGVAQQHEAAAAPAIVALAVEDRPQGHAVDRLKHALQVGMKADERFEILPARRRRRLLFAVPARRRHHADRVDFIAPPGQVIGQAVAVRPPPFGAVRNVKAVKACGRKNRAIRRGAGKARRLRPKQKFAHL